MTGSGQWDASRSDTHGFRVEASRARAAGPVCAKPRTADLEGKGRLGGRGASWSSLCAPRRLLRLEKRLNNKRYRIRNK
ncbi:hypothetical protein VULLAG_LOCUS23276 [Vulpes lagopus]